MPSIKEMILSEEYTDLILPLYTGFLEDYKDYGSTDPACSEFKGKKRAHWFSGYGN